MRRIMVMTFVLSLLLLSFAGMASAAYNPEDDVKVSVNLPVKTPSTGLGSLTFNLQQAVHSQLTSTTGLSPDYFYIWLYVNGDAVAAVDPAKVMY